MSRLPGLFFLNVFLYFLSYFPIQIWALETCNQDILKIIIASAFKLGQLVDDAD